MTAGWKQIAGLALLLLALAACSSKPTKIDNEPRTPAEINAELGMRYMQQGNLDIALKKLKRALEQDPDLAVGHHYMALLYQHYDSDEEAEKHFSKALSITPDNPSLRNNYGVFLCQHKRYQEAVDTFLKVAKSPYYSRPEEAYENAALCALLIPDVENGEAYLLQALKFDPLRSIALFQIAKLRFEQQQLEPARTFMRRYEKVSLPTAESLWLIIRIENQLRNPAAVKAYMQMLRRNFPDSAELREAEKVIS